MTRSTLLLVLASVMPSYFAALSDSGPAIFISILSTLVGFALTISVMGEFNDRETREKVRLGWILHIAGMMLVYAVHQLS